MNCEARHHTVEVGQSSDDATMVLLAHL